MPVDGQASSLNWNRLAQYTLTSSLVTTPPIPQVTSGSVEGGVGRGWMAPGLGPSTLRARLALRPLAARFQANSLSPLQHGQDSGTHLAGSVRGWQLGAWKALGKTAICAI